MEERKLTSFTVNFETTGINMKILTSEGGINLDFGKTGKTENKKGYTTKTVTFAENLEKEIKEPIDLIKKSLEKVITSEGFAFNSA